MDVWGRVAYDGKSLTGVMTLADGGVGTIVISGSGEVDLMT